jgi:hypothetical protein
MSTVRVFGSCSIFNWILLLLIPFSVLPGQDIKLRVTTPDSVLSLMSHRGSVMGIVAIEGIETPVAGAKVRLARQIPSAGNRPGSDTLSTYTDSTGSFSFGLIPESPYFLGILVPGYYSYIDSILVLGGEQLNLEIALAPDYSHPELLQTGGIEFEISDKGTGELIGNARIRLLETDRQYNADENGSFFLHNLIPAKHHFVTSADGYSDGIPEPVSVIRGQMTLCSVQLADSFLTDADLSCREEHRKQYPFNWISPDSFGTIVSNVYFLPSNEPVSDESVYLAPYGNHGTTDSSGSFTFKGLRPGVYCLTVRVPDYDRKTVHGIRVAAGKKVKINVWIDQ